MRAPCRAGALQPSYQPQQWRYNAQSPQAVCCLSVPPDVLRVQRCAGLQGAAGRKRVVARSTSTSTRRICFVQDVWHLPRTATHMHASHTMHAAGTARALVSSLVEKEFMSTKRTLEP